MSGCRATAAHFRGDRHARRRVFADVGVDRVRLTGGEPLLRRDLPSLVEQLAARPAITRSGADDQRRPAAAMRPRSARAPACIASPSASTRSIAERFEALDPLRRARRGARRHRRRGAAGFDSLKIDTRRHARRQRRRARRAARVRPRRRRRGALHRIHGRRRRHALDRRTRSSRAREMLARLEAHYGP